MSELSDLLEAHRPEDTSNRSIAEAMGVSPGTVDKYMSGDHGRASEATLKAFESYFHIPIDKLRAANGVPTGERKAWTPPPEADRLNRRQRQAVTELIRSIVSGTRDKGEDRTDFIGPVVGSKHPPVDGANDSEDGEDFRRKKV